ncbi:MAG: hypothetical protein GY854_04435 [Deltaproteobacteria bacterium]|nr:hypothetical protein [Deltaproteobacteria bacterium]
MSFDPFTFEQHQQFLLDTLRTKLPRADLSAGSFWQIWAQGQARGLTGITQALNNIERQILPDRATGIDLDHHAQMYDIPRLLPDNAVGKVRVTVTDMSISILDYTSLYLRDVDGRKYTLLDTAQLSEISLPGLYDIDVIADDPGADGNQVTDVEITFYWNDGTDDHPTLSEYDPDTGLEEIAWVVEPGLTGGRDQETDASLATRIAAALSAGRFSDTVEDYKKWVLDHHWTRRADRAEEYGLVLDNIHDAWVYRDETAPNRVYMMALDPPPDRIATGGFLQAIFNAVEEMSPVTVDPIVPMIREEGIDITVCVEPRSQARWDWVGVKMVRTPPAATVAADREIWLRRGLHPNYDLAVGVDKNLLQYYDGADGLESGMRVLISGEERVIGHIDRDVDESGQDRIFLTDDLSVVPSQYAAVYPGGPVTSQVHDAIARLFETLGPLHKTLVGTNGEQNVLVSVITDTLMEIADVHDVLVHTPEDMFRSGLLEEDGYLLGLLAYLAVPGRVSVVPMIEKDRLAVKDGVPILPYYLEKI